MHRAQFGMRLPNLRRVHVYIDHDSYIYGMGSLTQPCGHCIHHKCHQEYIRTSYQCPTCFKSLANMTEYFQRIDNMLALHSMPPEYANTMSHVYCNDCETKTYAKYHFLYHKCGSCEGYNTKILNTVEGKPEGANQQGQLPQVTN